MQVDIMRSGGRRSQQLIEEVESHICLMILLSGHLALLLQGPNELLTTAGLRVGMEEVSGRVTLLQPKEMRLLPRYGAPQRG
jgi:hypothetical protein